MTNLIPYIGQPHVRDYFVARILAGYIKFSQSARKLYTKAPSPHDFFSATELYNEFYEEALLNGCMTEDDALSVLIQNGSWTEDMEEAYKILPDNIDKLKVELYKSALNKNLNNKTREFLEVSRLEYERLSALRGSLDSYTCHGIASYVKWTYIIEHSTYDEAGKKYSWEDISLYDVMSNFNQSLLGQSSLRYLAHMDPWTSTWTLKKKNGFIFPEPLTQEQKGIFSWSLFYDNIYEAHESPAQFIIEDDDMLDGWVIIQQKKRDEDKKKVQVETGISQNKKIQESDEVFIRANSREEANAIYDLNDMYGKSIVKSRMKQVAQKGTVSELEFHDVKQRLFMEAQQVISERAKNGRKR